MSGRTCQAHYIKPNHSARVPHDVVVLHVTSIRSRNGNAEYFEWGHAAAGFLHWPKRGARTEWFRTFTDRRGLWDTITDSTSAKRRVVLYAHNLPYVMRVSGVFDVLPELGWELADIRLANEGSWCVWRKDGCTLTMADSASVWPCTLRTLGALVRPFTDPLFTGPAPAAESAVTRHRCAVLAAAVGEYLGWLRSGAAGNWQITGAGQAWAHWRHNFYTHRILVHTNIDALRAERRAQWCGRAEAWQWGRDESAPVYEWDIANAYPRLARDNPVPTVLLGEVSVRAGGKLARLPARCTLLADVDVSTEQPVVPAEHGGGIVWPVGSFATTLWWPEVEALRASGASVTVTRAWLYRVEPALRSWGSWAVGMANGAGDVQYGWLPLVAKHWSRALIGRFAMRYATWVDFAAAPVPTVRLSTLVDRTSGETRDMLQVGNAVRVASDPVEPDNSCPQVAGYVACLCRVRLWEIVQLVGQRHVLYVDTDSLIVDPVGNEILKREAGNPVCDGLRVKHRHRGYEIWGPRTAIFGGVTKLSGIPRDNVRVSETSWSGIVFRRLSSSLESGQTDRVAVTDRSYSVAWNDKRRARVAGGRTVPYRLPDGVSSQPIGDLEPVLEREKVEYVKKALGAQVLPKG